MHEFKLKCKFYSHTHTWNLVCSSVVLAFVRQTMYETVKMKDLNARNDWIRLDAKEKDERDGYIINFVFFGMYRIFFFQSIEKKFLVNNFL